MRVGTARAACTTPKPPQSRDRHDVRLDRPGRDSQGGVYYLRIDGATGAITAPARIDSQADGHQLFPAIDADAGTLHALWWDSRNDPAYSPARPVGNMAAGVTVPSLDVYASARPTATGAWSDGCG